MTIGCSKSFTVGVDISGSLSVAADFLDSIIDMSISTTWSTSSSTSAAGSMTVPDDEAWGGVYYSYIATVWNIRQEQELWTCTISTLRTGCLGPVPYSPHKWKSPIRAVTVYVPQLSNGNPQYGWSKWTGDHFPLAKLAPLGSSSS